MEIDLIYAKNIIADQLHLLEENEMYVVVWIGDIYREVNNSIKFRVIVAKIKRKDVDVFDLELLSDETPIILSLPFTIYRIIYLGQIIYERKLRLDKRQNFVKSFVLDNRYNYNTIKYSSLFDRQDISEIIKNSLISKSTQLINKIFKGTNYHSWFDPINSDNVWVVYVVPTNEIARFYYFPSTRMAYTLIEPDAINSVDSNKLYLPSSLSGNSEYKKRIVIRNRMHLSDAPHLARIAYSTTARKGASEISKTMIYKSSPDQNSFYINTFFPYDRDAKIKVRGIEILQTYKGQKLKIVLVFEIVSCNAEFPFEALRYSRETPNTRESINEPPKTEDGDHNPPREVADLILDPALGVTYTPSFYHDPKFDSSKKADNRTTPIKIIDRDERFPNLTKDIEREIIHGLPKLTGVPQQKATVPTGLTTNDQKGGSTGSAGTIITSEEKRPPAGGNMEDYMSDLRKEFKNDGASFFPPGDTSNLILTIKPKDGNTNPRRLIVLPVKYRDKYFLVIELEPLEQSKYALRAYSKKDFSKITNEDFVAIINSITTEKGNTPPKDFLLKKILHTTEKKDGVKIQKHKDRILSNLGIR